MKIERNFNLLKNSNEIMYRESLQKKRYYLFFLSLYIPMILKSQHDEIILKGWQEIK